MFGKRYYSDNFKNETSKDNPFSIKTRKNLEERTDKEKNECSMCKDTEGIVLSHQKLYNTLNRDNVLFETDNFSIVVDNYPVCDNHILIVPKTHFVSYSTIPNENAKELEAIIQTLAKITETSDFILFEHGSNMVGTNQKLCGNSIYHAHLHFIPNVNLSREQIVQYCISGKNEQKFELVEDKNFDECISYNTGNKLTLDFLQKDLSTKEPYLFCRYSNLTGATLCIPDSKIKGGSAPSQFFRRVFAEVCNPLEKEPFFNWKIESEVERSKNIRNKRVGETKGKFANKKSLKQNFESNLKELQNFSIKILKK